MSDATFYSSEANRKGLMDMACLLPLIILLLLLSSLPSRSDDQLTQGKPLFPGDKLISENGVFALGFFSPTNSNESLYIAICYHGIPEQLPVWVANRDNPATSTAASPAKLAITQNQGLVLSDTGGRRTFWTTAANTTASAGVAVAVLLNSGNFVLRSANGTVLLWQSFDHPTAVILPTMRVLFRYKGRVATRLFAWKGPSDPSTGALSGSIDPGSNLRFFIWNGTRPYSRINLFNDVAMFGGSGATTSVAQWMDNTGDELYFTYRVSDGGSPYTRLLFEYNGKMKLETWSNTTLSWKVMFDSPSSACDLYAWCGSFGYCDSTEGVPTCRCLDGFEPVDGRDLSRGCRRTEALECGKEARFVTMTGMRLPDKFVDVWNRNGSFDECAAECRDNCSCTAFAYISKSTAPALTFASRCLVWTGDLVDTGKAAGFGRELYLRLAGSHVKNKINFAKIVPPVIALLLLLTCAALFWKRKYQGKRQRKEARRRMMLQYLRSPDEAEDKNIEFPFIRFEDIVVATDNFADSNMLGKGGFGNVYKGMFDGTKEVAIKRLSKGSGQGTEEFRNEVVLIAKLQHKNLVKLLGCCIHENEKLLVYEYLPNKSLDYFLFDSSRKSMLQWDTRCKIIQGIARGILYLHQDSRLTIIHRDLKPSNILLDKEMSPKISDFGMARIFYGEQHQANTNRVVGTYGYMSPEYAMEGAFSVKSDTYSFGVLLLEIVSGLKISSPQLIMDFPNLIVYAWNLWKDGKAEDLLDSSVKEYCPSDQVSRCIHIGLLCVQDHPECRPLMSAVVSMLENKTTQLPVPTEPVYFVRRDAEPGRAGNKVLSLNDMTFTELEGR